MNKKIYYVIWESILEGSFRRLYEIIKPGFKFYNLYFAEMNEEYVRREMIQYSLVEGAYMPILKTLREYGID